jgi:hypothetical protein
MHSLFHIKTVIIPIVRYRPEGFSPRVDIGRGMITVLIWKKACINLFITNFNIELKRTKLTSHTNTKLMDILQSNKIKMYKNEPNALCLLCEKDGETIEHFILDCEQLKEVREPIIQEIDRVLNDCNITTDQAEIQITDR